MRKRVWRLMAVVALAVCASGGLTQRPMTVLFNEGFNDNGLRGRGWYDGDKFTISTRSTHTGTGCLEYHWPTGATMPSSSSATRHQFTPTDTVFVRFYIKLSHDWSWTGRPYHPHLMYFMTTEDDRYHGPASSHLTVYVEPHEGHLRLATQDITNEHAAHGLTQGSLRGGYNGMEYDSKEVLLRDERWHCIEAMFRLNSLDMKHNKPLADGAVMGWFDGRLVIDRTDVILRSTDFPGMQFNQLLLGPYFGVGLLPHAQTLWMDDLAVGTARIYPIESP